MSCDAVSLSWKQKLLAATTEIEDDLDLPLPFHIFLFYLFTKKKITQRFHDVNKKKSQTKTIKIFIFSCLVAHIIIIFFRSLPLILPFGSTRPGGERNKIKKLRESTNVKKEK